MARRRGLGRLLIELWRSGHHYRRLRRRAQGFQALPGRRARLHFPVGLPGHVDPAELLRQCEADREGFETLFGLSFRGRVAVYLFATVDDISAVFERRVGAIALGRGNTIALAAGRPVDEDLRDELVHLFSLRWNPFAPPLLSEGLSVWLQGTYWGEPIHRAAARLLRRHERPNLYELADPDVFGSPSRVGDNYLLAGSFTGFLIRRLGWDGYRGLYRGAVDPYFSGEFRRRFGGDLGEAGRRWSDEVLTLASLDRRREADTLFARIPLGRRDRGWS